MTEDSIAPDVFARLQKAAAGEPTELADLCRNYLVEGRRTLDQLRSALTGNDAAKFRDRAHYLRGSSLVMGATAVARHCASLEQMARTGDLGEAASLLDQTSRALDAAQAELARLLGQPLPVGGPAT